MKVLTIFTIVTICALLVTAQLSTQPNILPVNNINPTIINNNILNAQPNVIQPLVATSPTSQPQPNAVPPQPNAVPPQPNAVPPQPNAVPPQPNAVPPQPNVVPQPSPIPISSIPTPELTCIGLDIPFLSYTQAQQGHTAICATCEDILAAINAEKITMIITNDIASGCHDHSECTLVWPSISIAGTCGSAALQTNTPIVEKWVKFYNDQFQYESLNYKKFHNTCGIVMPGCRHSRIFACEDGKCVEKWEVESTATVVLHD